MAAAALDDDDDDERRGMGAPSAHITLLSGSIVHDPVVYQNNSCQSIYISICFSPSVENSFEDSFQITLLFIFKQVRRIENKFIGYVTKLLRRKALIAIKLWEEVYVCYYYYIYNNTSIYEY